MAVTSTIKGLLIVRIQGIDMKHVIVKCETMYAYSQSGHASVGIYCVISNSFFSSVRNYYIQVNVMWMK